ncbi:hypothetical protein BH11PSE7_BH11PSE7_03790 [soil metagenome]
MPHIRSKFASSIYNLLTGHAPDFAETVHANSAEQIRHCMLDALGEDGASAFASLRQRIYLARDVQSLWYLRSGLMAAMCDLHGELAARDMMARINQQFEGLLPEGLCSRPSPLSH